MTDYYLAADHPPSIDLPTPARALTIGAHPDDAEFGAGATLAKWAAAGCDITMLIMTDGSKGTWDPEMAPDALIAIRREEQTKAAERLGVTDVVMLDHVDGLLEATMVERAEVAWWVRSTRPDVVISHDPWRRHIFHPDHRAAGWSAVDGVVAARDHLFFPDQLGNGIAHHRPNALLLWATDEPDHWEDVTGHVALKTEALLCHSSQGTTTMDDADGSTDAATAFGSKIQERAVAHGHPVGLDAAEAFKLMVP